MVIYELGLNAFTLNSDDVIKNFRENKRFTMRDIGELEKRIETFKDKIEKLTLQADRFRQNLIRQFANLENAMAKLQSQSSAFQAQMGALG